MLNIKLNVAINDSDSFTFNNAAARIVGSKIVVEQGIWKHKGTCKGE